MKRINCLAPNCGNGLTWTAVLDQRCWENRIDSHLVLTCTACKAQMRFRTGGNKNEKVQ